MIELMKMRQGRHHCFRWENKVKENKTCFTKCFFGFSVSLSVSPYVSSQMYFSIFFGIIKAIWLSVSPILVICLGYLKLMIVWQGRHHCFRWENKVKENKTCFTKCFFGFSVSLSVSPYVSSQMYFSIFFGIIKAIWLSVSPILVMTANFRRKI